MYLKEKQQISTAEILFSSVPSFLIAVNCESEQGSSHTSWHLPFMCHDTAAAWRDDGVKNNKVFI